MKERYYVVSMDDDGDWGFIGYDTIEEVKDQYGIDDPPEDYNEGYHPANNFTDYIDELKPGHILIRGTILLPKAKQIRTAWDFEEE